MKRVPNVTPSRVITVAMPSYTCYLNPHGSLVSRRWDLVKATQPIPVSKLARVVSSFYKQRSSSPISLGNAFLRSSDQIISLYFDCLRFHRSLMWWSSCTRYAFHTSFDDKKRHLMTSISVNCIWLNFLFLLGQYPSFEEYNSIW